MDNELEREFGVNDFDEQTKREILTGKKANKEDQWVKQLEEHNQQLTDKCNRLMSALKLIADIETDCPGCKEIAEDAIKYEELPVIQLPEGVRLCDLEYFACPECKRSAAGPFVYEDIDGIWCCVKCHVKWRCE